MDIRDEAWEQAAVLTRSQAVVLLRELEHAKREARAAAQAERRLRDQLVEYLELEGEAELADGELGIVCRLQERRRPDTYDVPRLADDVVARLAKIPGLLSVNGAALKALGDTSMDLYELRRVSMPGGVTTALVVSREGQPRVNTRRDRGRSLRSPTWVRASSRYSATVGSPMATSLLWHRATLCPAERKTSPTPS